MPRRRAGIPPRCGDDGGGGKAELVAANSFDDAVGGMLGRGDGGFGPSRKFTTGARPVSVAIGSFVGNTRPDLAVANNDDGVIGALTKPIVIAPENASGTAMALPR